MIFWRKKAFSIYSGGGVVFSYYRLLSIFWLIRQYFTTIRDSIIDWIYSSGFNNSFGLRYALLMLRIYKKSSSNMNPFDWYQDYEGIKDIITQFIKKTDRILNVGCGTSGKNDIFFS